MGSPAIAAHPHRPPDLPDWEDLLVRFEIMARALRVTLEEAGAGAEAAAALLQRLVRDEVEVAAWLHRASPGRSTDPGSALLDPPAPNDDAPALADRFVSLRARNFAMLQRRGIDVWEWSAPFNDEGVVTAYQMVAARVAADAGALRALREGLRPGGAAC